ncbi:MAG: hypothetical protein WCA89_10085 [Terracidiphilus sp.]|jgi:hypothetical protein
MMITKTKAAEQQLNTAIRLFFENRDHLSSYTLAAASREVTEGVIKIRCGELKQRKLVRVGDSLEVPLSYRETLDLLIKPDCDKKAVIKLFNKWQNFLKHSDNDPDVEIEPIKTKYLAVMIVFAIKNYALLTQDMTIEMKIFFAWFAVAEPELVRSEHLDVSTKKVIADMINYISGDPYDHNTLENIYTAMTEYNLWLAGGTGIDFETWGLTKKVGPK